ncbi:MAG: hypothetical protein JRH01_17785 [Deltaproteobacteria bacterium]|nr:hypothetical protein [Deltaproteobacteria bacterium]
MRAQLPTMRAKRWLTLLLGAALVWLPRTGQACAVCMGGREEESRQAFILATAFMTFLPMLLAGLAIWWLVRRMLEQERLEEAARATDDPPTEQAAASGGAR